MSVANIGQGIYGLFQTIDASKKLKNLEKPKDYLTIDELDIKAKGKAQGYSAQEKFLFFQNLVRQNNMSFNKAMSYRPDMANTISAGINYGNIDAVNQFSLNDANMIRQDKNRLFNAYQRQDERTVGDFNTRLREKELALGQQKQAGVQNVFAAVRGEEQEHEARRSDAINAVSTFYTGKSAGVGQQPKSNAPLAQQDYTGAPMQNAYYPQQPSYTDYGNSMYNTAPPSRYAPPYQSEQTDYGNYLNYYK